MAFEINRSVLFGGTDEYVTMGDVLDFEYNDSFSISFWFKGTGNAQYIVSKRGPASDYRGYSVYLESTGAITFHLTNVASSLELVARTTATGFNDGSWHHVVVTYDGTNVVAGVTIYIDDSSEAITNVSDTLGTNTTLNTGDFNISGRNNGTLVFVGNVDETAVYDKELSSAEVSEIYNSGIPNDLSTLLTAANLVAWWRMGEGDTFPVLRDNGLRGSNLAAPDESPSGNDGTPTNMESGDVVKDTAGGRASTFNGSDEYVTMGDVLDFEYNDPFSVSCWFKTTTHADGYLVAKLQSLTGLRGWGLNYDGTAGGNLEFMLWNGSTYQLQVDTVAVYDDGLWHHVLVTHDGSGTAAGVTYYIDGAEVTSTLTIFDDLGTNTTVNAGPLNIGSRTNGTYPFNGMIDEVAVYDKELSASEAEAVYNLGSPTDLSGDANLVGYWRMGDGATPPTIPDDSTNSNDGTMTNMDASNFVDGVSGDYSFASFSFDGVNEFVTMGNVTELDFDNATNDAFSISCWIKTSATGDYVVSKMTASPFVGYGLYIESIGRPTVFLTNGGSGSEIEVQSTSVAVNDGRWHHVVCTYDGSQAAAGVTIYVDGSPVAMTIIDNTLGTQTTANSAEFNISGRTNGSLTLNGMIDEVIIYNTELLSTQVSDLFGLGYPLDPTTLDSWASAVGYWRMGESSFDGTMTNMESGDIAADTPAGVNYYASALPPLGSLGSIVCRAKNAAVIDTAFAPASLSRIFYRMRAWNLNTADWELWTAEGAPNTNNPSGDPITNVSVLTSWEE